MKPHISSLRGLAGRRRRISGNRCWGIWSLFIKNPPPPALLPAQENFQDVTFLCTSLPPSPPPPTHTNTPTPTPHWPKCCNKHLQNQCSRADLKSWRFLTRRKRSRKSHQSSTVISFTLVPCLVLLNIEQKLSQRTVSLGLLEKKLVPGLFHWLRRPKKPTRGHFTSGYIRQNCQIPSAESLSLRQSCTARCGVLCLCQCGTLQVGSCRVSHPGYKGLWAAMKGVEYRERKREKLSFSLFHCMSHKSFNNASILMTPQAFIICLSMIHQTVEWYKRREDAEQKFRRRIVFFSASIGRKRKRLLKLSHFPVWWRGDWCWTKNSFLPAAPPPEPTPIPTRQLYEKGVTHFGVPHACCWDHMMCVRAPSRLWRQLLSGG